MATRKLKIGSRAPDFRLMATDGNYYTLDELSNRSGIIVMFGCNHCPYVQAYEDRVMEIKKEFEKDINVVVINSNDDVKYPEDSFENMIKRSKVRKFNFLYLWDETQSVANAFDASHTPEIFLFDKELKLRYHGKIDDNWQEPENVKTRYLKDAVEEMIKGKEVSIPETFSIGCTIKWK